MKQTRDQYIDKHMKIYKTECCQAYAIATDNGRIVCTDCARDVTEKYVLIAKLFGERYDNKQKIYAEKESRRATKEQGKHRSKR